jgi:hypothetical protein
MAQHSLSVLGLRHGFGVEKSSRADATARPRSARPLSAHLSHGVVLPASEPKYVGTSRLQIDDTVRMGSPRMLSFSQADFNESMRESEARAPLVPKLVLAGVPTPKGALSQRAELSRQAHANRLAVKIALERFGFPDGTAEKREETPEVAYHRRQGSRASSPNAPPTPKLQAIDKEPTSEQVAKELGARLDPVHPCNNPEKYRSQRLTKPAAALSVPDDLTNLSLAAKAIASAEELREAVAAASDVRGTIGTRRPGYNPLLRKYEQRMPKSKALYLAGGRNVLSAYPEETKATPRRTRRDLSLEAIGATEEEEEEGSKTMLRPALERLAQHKVKAPGLQAKNLGWSLRPELRRPHTARDFQQDNTTELQRYERCRRISEIQQRTAQHFSRVRSAHQTAIAKKEETRAALLQKEVVRAERLSQAKREHEMQMEREGHQRAWLKQITVLLSAQLMLQLTTLNTDHHDAAAKLLPLKINLRGDLSRKAAVVREVKALKRQKEVNRYNTFALIRWFFDNRPLFGGKRCVALSRWMLRRKFRRQMKYIEDASTVVTNVLVAAGHVKMTMMKITKYKEAVINSQRMLRKAAVRRDKHIVLIMSHVKEYTALMIVREMILGVSSLFPPSSSFKGSHELLLAHHTNINTKLMRSDDIKNLGRIFPGVPLWLAVAMEKLRYPNIHVLLLVAPRS